MGIKYKIRDFGGGWDILNVESKISIPRDSGNSTIYDLLMTST